jgi:hypothetical protein
MDKEKETYHCQRIGWRLQIKFTNPKPLVGHIEISRIRPILDCYRNIRASMSDDEDTFIIKVGVCKLEKTIKVGLGAHVPSGNISGRSRDSKHNEVLRHIRKNKIETRMANEPSSFMILGRVWPIPTCTSNHEKTKITDHQEVDE